MLRSFAQIVFRPALPLIGLGLTLLLGLCGCSHYQLGTAGQLSFHTLYVAPVENNAQLPQAVAVISTQLREAFLRDSRVEIVHSPAEADATLTVSLAKYARAVATVRPGDTGLARKFELTLDAVCTLRDNRSGANLFEKRPVSATRQVFTTPSPATVDPAGTPIVGNQQQAEYQTLPLLASSLADNVVHTALDVW